jgi:hypothetical protein
VTDYFTRALRAIEALPRGDDTLTKLLRANHDSIISWADLVTCDELVASASPQQAVVLKDLRRWLVRLRQNGDHETEPEGTHHDR